MTALAGLIGFFAALAPDPGNGGLVRQWIAARAADLPLLHAFTRGLDRDLDAAIAAATLPFHNGRTEGVNTKTILWNQICQVLQVVGLLFAGSRAGGAVDAFAQEVRMAVMPGVLSDHVHHDPSQ
jgi:hypothetical protein